MHENNINEAEIMVDDDSDMPMQETKEYNEEKHVELTEKFMTLFNQTVELLPYATVLKNHEGTTVHLIELVHFVERCYEANDMPLSEFEKVIGFLANISFKYSRGLMEIFEDKDGQKTLFEYKN